MDQFLITITDGLLVLQHVKCGQGIQLPLGIAASSLVDAIMGHRCAT